MSNADAYYSKSKLSARWRLWIADTIKTGEHVEMKDTVRKHLYTCVYLCAISISESNHYSYCRIALSTQLFHPLPPFYFKLKGIVIRRQHFYFIWLLSQFIWQSMTLWLAKYVTKRKNVLLYRIQNIHQNMLTMFINGIRLTHIIWKYNTYYVKNRHALKSWIGYMEADVTNLT